MILNHLAETNIGGLFSEALTADVETVFSDETSFVSADTAVKRYELVFRHFEKDPDPSSSLLPTSSETRAMGEVEGFFTYQPREPLP